MTDTEVTRQATSKAGFIRAYGLFWQADEVDWSSRELIGRYGQRRPKLQLANFWDQNGIYILYNDYGPYYVGQTQGQSMNLGKRLRQHLTGSNSHHSKKWDRFSWFGWRGVLGSTDPSGLQKLRAVPKQLLTDSAHTVGDIEALLIHALGTRNVGNRRDETFAAALRWDQVRRDEHAKYWEMRVE